MKIANETNEAMVHIRTYVLCERGESTIPLLEPSSDILLTYGPDETGL